MQPLVREVGKLLAAKQVRNMLLITVVAAAVGLTQPEYRTERLSTQIQADIEVVPTPSEEELEDIRIRASNGEVQAQLAMGDLFYFGRGVEKDIEQAKMFYEAAARNGNVNAQYNLGEIYDKGRGGFKDDARAYNYYLAAARQGHVQAQYGVGVLLAQGRGVLQDYGAAVDWLRLAADKGYVRAIFNLGNMYMHGQGVERNPQHSMTLYEHAAKQGYAEAQFNLAVTLASGGDVPANPEQAYKWFEVVRLGGGFLAAQARQGLMYLENNLSNDQKVRMQRNAQACYTSDFRDC